LSISRKGLIKNADRGELVQHLSEVDNKGKEKYKKIFGKE